jgi:hypothetical protein
MYRGREPGAGDVEMYARAPRTPGDDTSEDDCTEQTPLSGSAPTASSSLVRGKLPPSQQVAFRVSGVSGFGL